MFILNFNIRANNATPENKYELIDHSTVCVLADFLVVKINAAASLRNKHTFLCC